MAFINKKTTSNDARLPAVIEASKYLIANAQANAWIQTLSNVQAGTYRGVTYLEDFGVVADGVADDFDEAQAAFNAAPAGSVVVFPSRTMLTSAPIVMPKSNKGLKIIMNGAELKAHGSWSNAVNGGKGLLHFQGGSGAEDSWEFADFVCMHGDFNPNGKQAIGISCEDFRASGNNPDHIKGGILMDLKGLGSGSVAGNPFLALKNLENGCLMVNIKAEGWEINSYNDTDPLDNLETGTKMDFIVKIHNTDNNGNWTWIGGKLSPKQNLPNGGAMLGLIADPSPINRDRIIGVHLFGRKQTTKITGLYEFWNDGGGRYNNRTHVREAFSVEDCRIGWDIRASAGSGARGYMASAFGLENKNNGADFEADHRLLRINGDIQGDFSGFYLMNQGGDNNIWNYIENNSGDPINFYPADIQMRATTNTPIMRVIQGSAYGLATRKMHFGGTDTIVVGRTPSFSGSADRFLSPFGETSNTEATETDVMMPVPFDDYVIRELFARWDVNTRTQVTPLDLRISSSAGANPTTKATINIPAGGGAGEARTVLSGNVDYRNDHTQDNVFGQNTKASLRLRLSNLGGTGNLAFTGIYAVLQKIGNLARGV